MASGTTLADVLTLARGQTVWHGAGAKLFAEFVCSARQRCSCPDIENEQAMTRSHQPSCAAVHAFSSPLLVVHVPPSASCLFLETLATRALPACCGQGGLTWGQSRCCCCRPRTHLLCRQFAGLAVTTHPLPPAWATCSSLKCCVRLSTARLAVAWTTAWPMPFTQTCISPTSQHSHETRPCLSSQAGTAL